LVVCVMGSLSEGKAARGKREIFVQDGVLQGSREGEKAEGLLRQRRLFAARDKELKHLSSRKGRDLRGGAQSFPIPRTRRPPLS